MIKACLFFSFLSLNLGAANWYVRSGGSGNGTDWNNAASTGGIWSQNIQPGDTIWMAGGSYSGNIGFNKSGTSGLPITIKRATANDAVPVAASGWQPTFDSTIFFGGSFYASAASYVVLDGQTDYGIVWDGSYLNNNGTTVWKCDYCTGIELRHIRINGPGVTTLGGNAIWFLGGNNGLVSHCEIDGVCQQISLNGAVNITVEYGRFINCGPGDANNHPDVLYANGANHLIWRYNVMSNVFSECVFWDVSSAGANYFYGNVFDAGFLHNGVALETKQGYSWGDFHVYNNTFIGWPGAAVYFRGSQLAGVPNNEVYNNIFWNTANNYELGTSFVNRGNNFFSGGSEGQPGDIGGGANPFVNLSQGNYHIVSTVAANFPKDKGRALGSTYQFDADGNTRGADFAWDMGAYEYSIAGPNTDPFIFVTPQSLSFPLLVTNTSYTNIIAITNIGGGTLTGSASVNPPFFFVGTNGYTLGSNVGTILNIRYSPTNGSATNLTASFTGGGGASVSLSGTSYIIQPALTFASTAGTLVPPYTTGGGRVFQVSEAMNISDGGVAVYGFNISSAGTYYVTNNILSPNDGANSIWWNIDNFPSNVPTAIPPGTPAGYQVWDSPINTNALNQTLGWRGNGTFTSNQFLAIGSALSVGNHVLIAVGREPNTQLGQWSIGQQSTNVAPPVAAFTNSNPTGSIPLTVYFTNLSTGAIAAYLWDFGDGATSAGTNTSHTFINSGTYGIILTVSGPGGSSLHFADNLVNATNPPASPNPVANFVAAPLSGSAPLTVYFTNLSTGSTSNLWDFGDTSTSTLTNSPSHTYLSAASYSPSLLANQSGSNNVLRLANYIVVTNLPAPVAAFSASPTNGASPLPVFFTNLSQGAQSSVWSLGDGTTNVYNPSVIGSAPFPHVYTNGTYTVRLSAIGTGGTNVLSKTNFITVTNGPPIIPITNKPPFFIRVFTQ